MNIKGYNFGNSLSCPTGLADKDHEPKPDRDDKEEELLSLGLLHGQPVILKVYHHGQNEQGIIKIADVVTIRCSNQDYHRFSSGDFKLRETSNWGSEELDPEEVVRVALEQQITFDEAERIVGREHVKRRQEEEKEKIKNLPQFRLWLFNSPEAEPRRQELLKLVRNRGKFFTSWAPLAWPYLLLNPNNVPPSEDEQAVMGIRVGKPCVEEFDCPICGQKFRGDNGICPSCKKRISPDYDQEELKTWNPFENSWPDQVKKTLRLYQRLCQCGAWSDQPTCPDCVRVFESKRAGGKLQSALKKLIGKRIKVACEDWPVVIQDILTDFKIEKYHDEDETDDSSDWDRRPEFQIKLVFTLGTTAKFKFSLARSDEEAVHASHINYDQKVDCEVKIFAIPSPADGQKE